MRCLTSIQCIYDPHDPEAPCLFCRSHNAPEPCVKILGPKTEARVAPSRPITRYDPSIEPQHVNLLQYLYSNEYVLLDGYKPFRFLFRLMSSIYTPSIEHIGLRHAILACAAYHLDRGDSALHVDQAIRELRRKLRDPNNIDEGDLFLSCLLARCGSYAEQDREQMICANSRGFVSIMRHLFNRVQGAIDHYPLAIFWPLARDFLGIVESEYKYEDLGLWDASCQVLGLPTIRQTLTYLDALPSENKDKPPEVRLYAIFMLYRQSESMRALIRFETRRQCVAGFSLNMLQTGLPIKQLQDDHMPPSTLYQETMAEFSSTLQIISIPIECMSAAESAKIRSATPAIIEMCQVILVWQLNRLLRELLRAPSVVEGLISPEGIEAGLCIATHARTMGGTVFLNGTSCEVDEESDEIGVCLQFWKHLVPKANKKFFDSSMNRFSFFADLYTPYGQHIRLA